jgi:uncharacterized membrane protein
MKTAFLIIRPMAFNQGYYNLFLAMGAGVVLFFSVKKSRGAAIIQAGPPFLGVLFIALGLA